MAQAAQTDMVFVKTAPEDIVQGGWYRMPLLGPGYLAAFMREKGLSVEIVDAMFDQLSLQETVSRIARSRPRWVCITAMTHEINRANEVALVTREACPDARFFVGGPHASALPAQTLEEFPVFEAAVIAEGEQSLWELWRAYVASDEPDLSAIAGIAWRDKGQVRVNAARPWLTDLDALPRPAWDLYDTAEVYQIFASRGCPFPCIFCMRVLGSTVRFRSPTHVVDEFEWLVETYAPKRIDFSDETFTLRRDWALEICDELVRRGLHKKMPWFANGRVNVVDEELLARMKEAGCVRMGFGVESGNTEILKVAQKQTTIEQVERAIGLCKQVGLETEAFYILGFPGETRETALDTIRLAARLNTTTAAFGIMVPYPGTGVAEMAAKGEGGYRLLSDNWSDFDKHLGNALEMENLSRKDLEKLQARAYLWFYLRNLRLVELASFFWEKRKAVLSMARKILLRR